MGRKEVLELSCSGIGEGILESFPTGPIRRTPKEKQASCSSGFVFLDEPDSAAEFPWRERSTCLHSFLSPLSYFLCFLMD